MEKSQKKKKKKFFFKKTFSLAVFLFPVIKRGKKVKKKKKKKSKGEKSKWFCFIRKGIGKM